MPCAAPLRRPTSASTCNDSKTGNAVIAGLACKATPEGGAVGTRIAHEAVTVALVELHDALIALETI